MIRKSEQGDGNREQQIHMQAHTQTKEKQMKSVIEDYNDDNDNDNEKNKKLERIHIELTCSFIAWRPTEKHANKQIPNQYYKMEREKETKATTVNCICLVKCSQFHTHNDCHHFKENLKSDNKTKYLILALQHDYSITSREKNKHPTGIFI